MIRCLGGIRPTASLLGVAVSTVQGWKERGAIPANRHQAILEAAERHGVDLAAGAPPAAESSSSLPQQPLSAATDSRAASLTDQAASPAAEPASSAEVHGTSPNRGVAWLALTLAGAALIAVITQPAWQPVLFPDAAPSLAESSSTLSSGSQIAAIEGRISILEEGIETLTARSEAALSGSELATLSDRVTLLEQSAVADGSIVGLAAEIARLGDRLAVLEQGLTGQDAAADIDALKANIGALSSEGAAWSAGLVSLNERVTLLEQSAVADCSIEGLAADISRLGDRLAVLEQDLTGQDAAAGIDSLKASIVALSTEVAAWSARLAALETAPVSEGGSVASRVLAVGQLDAAIRAGAPFASALERMQTLASDDFIVAGALAPLTVWAEDGIPTVTDLRLRFKSLLPELTRPAKTAAAGDGWWPRVRDRLTGLVSVRRIGTGEDLSPLARGEQAVELGDLEAAIAVLEEGAAARGEATLSWIAHAKARLAAEAALASLEAYALDELAKAGTATP